MACTFMVPRKRGKCADFTVPSFAGLLADEPAEAAPVYSPLRLDALMIGHQRSASAFWKARRASGDCCASGVIWMPSSSKRFFTMGSASTCTRVAFNLAMMSLGVSFGTQRPYQSEAKKPGSPSSSAVGISGDDGSRALPVIAYGLTLPAPTSDLKFDDGSIMKSIC